MSRYVKSLAFIVIYNAVVYIGVANTPNNMIKFYDIGQGDSALIRANGVNILVDGGPFYNLDQVILADSFYLNCHFDLVVVTHRHYDHYSGLERLSKRCHFDLVWEDGVSAGEKFAKNGLKLEVLWPQVGYHSPNENNNSIVLLVQYGTWDALLLGDVELDGLSRLSSQSISEKLSGPLDFYKVSHHGSSNGFNAAFVAKLRPKNCVISVGKNDYGHPDSQVIAKLTGLGCRVYRTDELGSIEFYLD